MKAHPECVLCLIQVRGREILASNLGLREKREALEKILSELTRLLGLDEDVPVIATRLFRMVRRFTGIDDPYRREKILSDEAAARIEPYVERWVYSSPDGYERFRRACIAAVGGNTLDVGALEHSFSVEKLDEAILELKLTVDDTVEAYRMLSGSNDVVYVCDNAGEIFLDKPLIKVLKDVGCRVTVFVKNEPYQNDATVEDAVRAGLTEVADEVFSSIPGTSGMIIEEFPLDAVRKLEDSSFLVLKGMANFETVDRVKRYGKPILCLLQAKCTPIARVLGVPLKSSVARLLKP